jgi:hypothetical protein
MSFAVVYSVRNLAGTYPGISRLPTTRKIISVNASKAQNPLTLFFTIFMIRLTPSSIVLVSRGLISFPQKRSDYRSTTLSIGGDGAGLVSLTIGSLEQYTTTFDTL